MKLVYKIWMSIIFFTVLLAVANLLSTSYVLKSLQEERLRSAEVVFAESLAKRIYRNVVDEDVGVITDAFFDEKGIREGKIEYIMVFNRQDYLLAHTFIGSIPKELLMLEHEFGDGEDYRLKKISHDEMTTYDVAVPVMEGLIQVGTVHLGIAASYVENIVTPTGKASTYNLAIAGIVVVLASLGAIIMSRAIVKPIVKLTRVAEDISKGKLDTTLDTRMLKAKDEVGDLARAFDRTMVSLKLAMRDQAEK